MFVLGGADGNLYSFAKDSTQLTTRQQFTWPNQASATQTAKKAPQGASKSSNAVFSLYYTAASMGTELLIGGRKDGTVAVWQIQSGGQPSCLHSRVIHQLSPNGPLQA